MRSSSEVRAVRVRNNVGQSTKVSDWHVIVPGYGKDAPSPGVACGTGLVGSRQFETYEGVKSREGHKHEECFQIAIDWINGLPKNPGPVNPEPENEPLAAPGEGGGRRP